MDKFLFVCKKNNAGSVQPQQWVFRGIYQKTKAYFIVNVSD